MFASIEFFLSRFVAKLVICIIFVCIILAACAIALVNKLSDKTKKDDKNEEDN